MNRLLSDVESSPSRSTHLMAVLQAVLVTFLWSTSWILIKFGLRDIPALTFAGLRYSLAFLFLLPLILQKPHRSLLRDLPKTAWLRMGALGLLFYAVTQGSQFLGLFYLPAITVSLLLNFTTLIVAVLGIFLLGEKLTPVRWLGLFCLLAGIWAFFYPVTLPGLEILGLAIVSVGVLANALSAILGRSINRQGEIPPIVVTTISMGIGAGILLLSGLLIQGMPVLDLQSWGIILWLSLVNTAFAFTLWNLTLRTLSAVESSIINNTMLIQIALLAWIFLGESLTTQQVIGMLLVLIGTLVVQIRDGIAFYKIRIR
jgi:drug/metabolite transporter (DMT)-like permease